MSLSLRCSDSLTLSLKQQRQKKRFRLKFCGSVLPAAEFLPPPWNSSFSLNQEVHRWRSLDHADESWVMSFHLAALVQHELKGGGAPGTGGETQTLSPSVYRLIQRNLVAAWSTDVDVSVPTYTFCQTNSRKKRNRLTFKWSLLSVTQPFYIKFEVGLVFEKSFWVTATICVLMLELVLMWVWGGGADHCSPNN